MTIGKHATDEKRRIAEAGTILRCQVGSGVHGTSISGTDDRDEMGICIEPPDYVIGLRAFEQYEYHTAWERPGGLRNRSGHGDLDVTVYCHHPGSRVLTADLRWEEIAGLQPGCRLVTFDEGSPPRSRHRHFSTGTITATQTRVMDRCKVVTSEGETVVTPDHGFLVRKQCQCKRCRQENMRRTRWMRADELQPGDLIYYLRPWDSDRSWEAGYLAGQFDGDGHLSLKGRTGETGVSDLGWSQQSGRPDVTYMEEVLAGCGFKSRTHGPNTSGCDTVYVAGNWDEQMRFLGSVRPVRLLSHPQLTRLWEARSLQTRQRAIVREVVPLPPGEMVAMETDTRTYIADGFLTHNSARKWMRLALNGNPSVLLPLFVPEDEIVTVTPLGRELRDLAPVIVSRQAGHRFAGYLEAQRRSMLSHEGKGRDCTRPELIEKYGYDTKFAAHMVRLGYQGVELLETGWITLPMPEPQRAVVREIRLGRVPMDDALKAAGDLEARLRVLTEESPLRAEPDRDAADAWLVGAYERAWSGEAA